MAGINKSLCARPDNILLKIDILICEIDPKLFILEKGMPQLDTIDQSINSTNTTKNSALSNVPVMFSNPSLFLGDVDVLSRILLT
jgi:hypothetical protein